MKIFWYSIIGRISHFWKILDPAKEPKILKFLFVWTNNNFSRAPSIARWTDIAWRLSSSIFLCPHKRYVNPRIVTYPNHPRDPYNLATYISRILNQTWNRNFNTRNLKFSKINFGARFIIFNIANACCWLAGRVPNLVLHKVWIWRHCTTQQTTWSILLGFLSSPVTWLQGHSRSFILFVKIVVVIFGMEYGALCCSFGPSFSDQPTLFSLSIATTSTWLLFWPIRRGLEFAWGWSHKILSFSDLPGLFWRWVKLRSCEVKPGSYEIDGVLGQRDLGSYLQHDPSYRSDLVQSLYNSTAQCATWLFPYNTYKYPVVWSAKDSPLTSGEQFFYQVN